MRSTRRGRRPTPSTGSLVVLVLLATACGSTADDTSQQLAVDQSSAVARKFVAAWNDPTADELKGLVDRPDVAAQDMQSYLAGADVTSSVVDVAQPPSCRGDECVQKFTVHHRIAGFGRWSYAGAFEIDRRQGQWAVEWEPDDFFPDLSGATTLVAQRTLPVRAVIIDRNGVALTPQRRIVRVGVVPRRVTERTYPDLSGLLGIDPDNLRDRVAASQPNWFVPVIDLRRRAYRQVKAQLDPIPGIVVDRATRALAPTAAWGRAVLGSVGPATDETLRSAGAAALASDDVGSGGLQQAYQRELAGRPGLRIDLVEKGSGAVVNTVFSRAPRAGRPLQTSLDLAVQSAAEHAVATARRTTSLVVVKASTGEILAAANAPGPTSLNSAFVGEYAPGSTFKVVTGDALLDAGLRPATHVSCPDRTVAGGTVFHNYADGILPNGGTLRQAFAVSCNTAFIAASSRLGSKTLSRTARTFGIGSGWNLGLPSFSGRVPSAVAPVDRAAEAIGQGRILTSPLAMAMVAATVDSGVARTPTLLPQDEPGRRLGELGALRTRQLTAMMRLVVTDGTGTVVDLPGRPVYAKTGTAEVQSGRRITTNAWLIGFRGDIAFAVLVEGGTSGGASAAPIVSSLLRSLPSSVYR